VTRDPPHKAMQCPHPGCQAWALLATADEAAVGGANIWHCANGHHGPRIVTESLDRGSD
jgi:hypothetical protein